MPDTATTSETGKLRSKADDVIEAGYSRAQVGLDKARTGAHEAVAVTDSALEQARDYILENSRTRPLATIGAAVGVGVLLGLILRR